jgi:hypothetical protein
MLHAQNYDVERFKSETAEIAAHFEAQAADADD